MSAEARRALCSVASKSCARCEGQREETEQELREKEERQKKRDELRREFEDAEKRNRACAERVGQVLQKHVEAKLGELQPPRVAQAPWHDAKQFGAPAVSARPGFVPEQVFEAARFRLEEVRLALFRLIPCCCSWRSKWPNRTE